MNKFSKIVSSIAGKIQSSFLKIRPYNIISLNPKEHVIHLIVFRSGKILTFLRRGYGPYLNYLNIYLYDNEDNYSTPQKYELDYLDLFEKESIVNHGIYCTFELENEDLIICYSSKIEIRKKVNNIYSLIKKISYMGRVSEMKAKKLKNNRFIVGREFSISIQLWGRNTINNNYECMYEKKLPCHMNYSLYINDNSFLIHEGKKFLFYKHNFNNVNNKLLKEYESQNIFHVEKLGKRINKREIIKMYDFICEISCKITNGNMGVPKCVYKNNIYFFKQENKQILLVNANNLKIVKKYYIDLDSENFYDCTIKVISKDKILVLLGNTELIEYKVNKKNEFFKNRSCSENKSKFKAHLIKEKNGDLVFYGNKILFFNKKELISD